MFNSEVNRIITDCISDLNNAQTLIVSLGTTSSIVPYLNKYGIIRACGALEISYKSIVADYCSRRSKQQVKNFIEVKVRDNSANPTYDNICRILKSFDSNWHAEFKRQVDAHPDKSRILTSLKSLVDSRNDFAHGGNPSVTLSDTILYFTDSSTLIDILDSIIH